MTKACYIVDKLLEGGERFPVKAAYGGEFSRMLRAPKYWLNFWAMDAHGVFRFRERVSDDDYIPFSDDVKKLKEYLRLNNIVVPVDRWVLKMPRGYGILGRGVVGNSVLGRNETVALGCQPVDNPLMDEFENSRWKRGL